MPGMRVGPEVIDRHLGMSSMCAFQRNFTEQNVFVDRMHSSGAQSAGHLNAFIVFLISINNLNID